MRVLVVDDDPLLLANVQAWLTGSGLQVDVSADGESALAAVAGTAYDVIVLDVVLEAPPDGLETCRELRYRGVGSPVLMLSARDAVPDRVRGLEVGADDYLVKPFALEELEARIRALARRHLRDRSAVLHAGDLVLDTTTGQASASGRLLRLTRKESAMLEFLLHHRDAPQTQQAIFAAVWGYSEAPASNLVDVYAARLRRKLSLAGARATIAARKRQGDVLESSPATRAEDAPR